MIIVFGSINMDLVSCVEAIARPGETVLAPSYEALHGGKGANQAVAAARISLPGKVQMIAQIGDDGFGRAARDNLAANGIDVAGVGVGAEPTGCAFISVGRSGENAITVASGANRMLEASAVADDGLGSDVVLVLQMEVPFEHSLAVARRVQAHGGRVVWNLAPVPTAMAAADLGDLLAATDVLVVNEHEAMAAASILGPAPTDYEEAAQLLSGRGCTCVVTAGAKGAIAVTADGQRFDVMADAIVPVDTTGAGDTFVGILASGLDEGSALLQAMRRACRGASMACLAVGAQSAMPSRGELE